MFQTVRHWWTGGRGKVTARLFLFEFVVVVLGVLSAQALASWAADRSERREAERLVADIREQALTFNKVLNYWARFGPCLRDHVIGIAVTASNGGTMTSEEIGRPALPLPDLSEMSADDWRKVRAITEPATFEALFDIYRGTRTYQLFVTDTAQQWAALRLLDRAAGQPSDADRARVRLAALVIDNNLRWFLFQHALGSTGTLDRLGYAKDRSLPQSAAYVDKCGLLKDWR